MSMRILRGALGACLALAVSACGTWQSVKDGTVHATKAVFETKVKEMNLLVIARAALNQTGEGASLPVVLRIYQLRDDKPFVTASYAQLLAGNDALKAATLWSRDITLGPGQTLKVSELMDEATNYVGVVAFFRDTAGAEWSVLIPKAQWKKTDPVRLVAAERNLQFDTERQMD